MNKALEGYYCARAEDVVFYLSVIAFCIVAMTFIIALSSVMSFYAKKQQAEYWKKRNQNEQNH